MLEHEFGGGWTEKKLEKVGKYLKPYMQILSGKGFTTEYVDAFAGTGYRTTQASCHDELDFFDELDARDAQDYSDGSARIALRSLPPFDRYTFIEKDPDKCSVLYGLKDEFPAQAARIDIRNGDANRILASLCSSERDWKYHRAVMFLDPYGMQVEWKTIELIAATKAVDLWYLFPIGSVNRLLERRQCLHPGFAERLDRTFGAKDWRSEFYRLNREPTLFDDDNETISKDSSFDAIGAYINKRLKSVFPGVVEPPYLLRNTKNSPLFMLCFAEGNPSQKVRDLALRIAREILMKD